VTTASVLVFGKNGQVGSKLVSLLAGTDGFRVRGVDIDEIDLVAVDQIDDFIRSNNPRWVVNGSAHTAVDRAESEPELSLKLNALAPGAMARTCASIGARFIHYSTDYVFDGTASDPYDEDDPVNPQSVYGKTKARGEQEVFTCLSDAILFRTAWVYSRDGANFVNTMLRLASERSEISVVNDQFGSPTLADDLARVTVNVINSIEKREYPYHGGIFHATGQGITSWYEFCREIMRVSGNHHVVIKPIATADYPTPAPRPAYSVLSNRKLSDIYDQRLPDWTESLKICLGQD
jgi:dTDP-4-dehydrorhamnose reductase